MHDILISLSFYFPLLLQNRFLGPFQPMLQLGTKYRIYFFFSYEESCPSGDYSDKEKFLLIAFSKSFVMYNMDQFQQMLLAKLGNSSLFYLQVAAPSTKIAIRYIENTSKSVRNLVLHLVPSAHTLWTSPVTVFKLGEE